MENLINQIFCDDCFNIFPKIEDRSVDFILCDLPYGITNNKWDTPLNLNKLWSEYFRIIKDNGCIALNATGGFAARLIMSNIDGYKYEWVWKKSQGTGHLNAKKQPLRNHEQVLIFYRDQPTYNPQKTIGKPYKCKSGRGSNNYNKQESVITENNGERYPLSIIDIDYDKQKLHPTQKPVALCEYLIRTYTNENDVVLDNCMGVGSTIIAAKNTNRRYIGVENNREYYDIATTRLS
jgi:site-specific DNA-methyltransferase (adenine-specific)